MNIIKTRYKILAIGNPNENKTGHIRVREAKYGENISKIVGDPRKYFKGDGGNLYGIPTKSFKGGEYLYEISTKSGHQGDQTSFKNSTLFDTVNSDDLEDNHELGLL